jgi:hypothetical protein
MSIEPLEPVEPPSVVDGPWWTTAVDPVPLTEAVQVMTPLDRDPRAEALNIAQHATAYIPAPLIPSIADLRRSRRRWG